jgi:hypothetical protein
MFSCGTLDSEAQIKGQIGHTSPDQGLVLMIEKSSTSPKIVDAKNMRELLTIQGHPKDDSKAWRSILWGDTTFLSCDKVV